MKRLNYIPLLLAAAIFVFSCEKPLPDDTKKPDTEKPDTEKPDTEKPDTEKPDPEEPLESPFKLKVYDISSVSATVEVEPLDKTAPYYMDIINEGDFNQALQYGFDDYMSWFLTSLKEQTGKPHDEVVEMISSYGNDGFILTSLQPETRYYAFAVGIGPDGMTTTEVISQAFTTHKKEVSDNTISIETGEITYELAEFNISTTTDENYLFTIEPAIIVKDMSDTELTDYIIQNNIAWGGLEQMTYSGYQTIEWQGKAGWEYVAIAFGYSKGAVTTEIFRKPFSMAEGGNPAECSFSFSQLCENFEMNLTISPSDKSVVYISNYVEMSDLQALMAAHGGLDGAFRECLDNLIEEMIADLGTRERVIDLISIMGEQTFTTRYKSATEYIQWAVPVDQQGNPLTSFQFGNPFTTPEEDISDAALTLEGYKYYDGTELAELYPESFSNAKGYAVIELNVAPSESAVQWWSYVALEDLTDRSREVIIKNLLQAPTEANLTRQLIPAFWGTNTIMGVAQDSAGAYGPLMLQVIELTKEDAAPASELLL